MLVLAETAIGGCGGTGYSAVHLSLLSVDLCRGKMWGKMFPVPLGEVFGQGLIVCNENRFIFCLFVCFLMSNTCSLTQKLSI